MSYTNINRNEQMHVGTLRQVYIVDKNIEIEIERRVIDIEI